MKKDNAPPAKVAAIHDISGFGRCALTVVIPTLSAMGVQVCPVPTAVLSTHTGGYEGYTFLDLTDEISPYASHWKKINLSFDAIYSGFLANATQIKQVSDFIDTFGKNSLVVVDPVMGDDGKIYKTYCSELCDGMKSLVKKANLITPNITEAAYLTQTPYKPDFSKSEAYEMLDKLSNFGCEKIVITGIHNENSIMTVYSDNGQKGVFSCKMVNKNYPGTGDIFTSCLTGKMLDGENFAQAVKFSSEFVSMLIEKSSHYDYPEREGVLLEKYLYFLLKGSD
ncbi:MAG: pyridoxamine kinase [Ruminococcaceae bacterium]|nr:pyridoxamine kinase [Oscillospiraceae bacterium]